METRSLVQLFKLLKNPNTLTCLAIAMQPALEERGLWNNSTWQALKDEDKVVIPAIYLLTYFNLLEIAGQWLKQNNKNVDETS